MIISEDSEGAEHISIYKIYAVHGVSSYALDASAFNAWHITESGKTGEKFLCIDTHFHEAVSHWIFESAVYLPLFKILHSVDPTIRLHLKSPQKKYKQLFCEYFGIEPTYELPSENICFFPNPISAQNRQHLNPEFVPQLDQFFALFNNITTGPKTNDFVILPRQIRENYNGNDRNIDFSNIILAASKQSKYTYNVLNTDNIKSIQEQFDAVRSAKNIVVVDGAGLVINGLFAKDSRLLIIGNQTMWQTNAFPLARLLSSKISEKVYCIYADNNYVIDLINDSNNNIDPVPCDN